MSYSKVIVAVDLSEDSEAVLAVVREVQQRDQPEIHLITVVQPLGQMYGGMESSISAETAKLENEMELEAQRRLDAFAHDLGVDSSNARVLRGNPVQEIRDYVENNHAELVVTGSHGRHGFGLLKGSTATGVLHGIHCDVLAVRLPDPT